jgi:hypothetical protein
MLSKIGEDEDAVHRAVTRTVSGVIARTAPSLVARTVSLTLHIIKNLAGQEDGDVQYTVPWWQFRPYRR